MARRYDNTLRAQQAADTSGRILEVAERLFATEHFDRVTLSSVAKAAGVTIPTLQRKYGSKEGLFAALGDVVRERVGAQRGAPPSNDVEGAIGQLIAHYEEEGALIWHLLKQEAEVSLLHVALEEGRQVHRKWVETVFASALEGLDRAARHERVDALICATDLYQWKLLRLDFGRSRAAVEKTINAMAKAVAGAR
jgi:AcrR family transcriptional regulator